MSARFSASHQIPIDDGKAIRKWTFQMPNPEKMQLNQVTPGKQVKVYFQVFRYINMMY